jgi:hypothetical protein
MEKKQEEGIKNCSYHAHPEILMKLIIYAEITAVSKVIKGKRSAFMGHVYSKYIHFDETVCSFNI